MYARSSQTLQELDVANILVVDDDAHIRDVVRFSLEQSGHSITEAASGADALRCSGAITFDLVVLDVIMPDEDGLEVCRKLRAQADVPIIFLSSRDEELDRIVGLELGADDYVTKPFSPRELVARVKAVLRRRRSPEPTAEGASLVRGPLHIDIIRHRCTWNDREVALTVAEFKLLQCLATSPGKVFSRDELVSGAYGGGHFVAGRTIDSHIRRIRHKMRACGGDPVETVYGVGYRLRQDLA